MLPESEVIMEYLEERYPEPALWPVDPAERALGRLWLQRFDDRLGDAYYAARRGDEGRAAARRAARRARRRARGTAVPERPRVRSRRHRLRALDPARPRALRPRARPGDGGLARALLRAAGVAAERAVVSALMSLPPLVDAAWVQEHLGEEDLVLGDVRGPNAHQRGHLPRSIPLVLGSPPPLATRETVQEFAVEVQRRLGRHGVTGQERLVLYDRGDCVGAAASQQAALRGRPSAGRRARGRRRGVAGRARAGRGRAAEDQDRARAAARGRADLGGAARAARRSAG